MRNIILNAPVESGQFMSLKDCGETSFASGAMGRGAAVSNTSGRIIAPFSGRVLTVYRNAIEIISNDGIKLFIQVGDSSFYEEAVKENQQISTYQILAYFNINKVVMFAVKNAAEYGDITFQLGGQNYMLNTQSGSTTNHSQEDEGMEETKFTILGESLSGKTCYLLAMYSEMSQSINGYSIVAQNDRLDTELLESFENLDDESISKERFPQRSEQVIEYLFNLNYAHKTIMPFKWIDYPGRIMRDKNDEDYPKVAQNIRESSTLFICVDGELLVGDDTERKIKNVKRKCSMTINRYFGKYFEAGGKLPPVGIILTKADLFQHDTNEEEIRKILYEAFSPLFFAENIKIGVIPVTLGENIADDNYSGEVDPVNIHLPIFMGIFFALNEQIAAYKYKMDSNNRSINDMDYWKRDEEDSFFIWRDDDKIRRLSAQISNTQKENERIQQLIQNMEQNQSKFYEYLNQIMWFIDGSWRI